MCGQNVKWKMLNSVVRKSYGELLGIGDIREKVLSVDSTYWCTAFTVLVPIRKTNDAMET